MSFSPGQFITAQRLNRLQPKTYYGNSSGAITAAGSGDVAGCSFNITTETNGATANFIWTSAIYATGVQGTSSINARWDVNLAPVYIVTQQQSSLDKAGGAQVWSTIITTAGTYTYKLTYSNGANSNITVYTALMVEIIEVA